MTPTDVTADRFRVLFNALRRVEVHEAATPEERAMWAAARKMAGRRMYAANQMRPITVLNQRAKQCG
jgi:hypothetical protein